MVAVKNTEAKPCILKFSIKEIKFGEASHCFSLLLGRFNKQLQNRDRQKSTNTSLSQGYHIGFQSSEIDRSKISPSEIMYIQQTDIFRTFYQINLTNITYICSLLSKIKISRNVFYLIYVIIFLFKQSSNQLQSLEVLFKGHIS